MEYLLQYLQLIEVKPTYHKLQIPSLRPSKLRFDFNIKEIELWNSSEFGILTEEQNKKTGGGENGSEKIICMEISYPD
jgi:hypothetical protein